MKTFTNIFFRKRSLVFVVLIFTFTFTAFADFNFDLTVQPYKKTEFFADGKKINGKLLLRDNSLGRLRFKLPDNIKVLNIKHKGFNPISLSVNMLKKKNAFVVLQKSDSKYKTTKVFKTGGHPKSLVFVNNNTIAAALLQGNGFDLINIDTGKTKRITPPLKYAKKEGFVEFLIMKSLNELWISQMSTATIHVFDLISFKYKKTIQSSGQWSKVMAYNDKTKKVYLSNWISHDISVIDPYKKIEEKKIKVTAVPRGIEFSEDGKFIYCAQFENSDGRSYCRLLKKRLSDFKTVKEKGARGAKRHIVVDYKKDRLYLSDMLNESVEVYSLKDDSLIKTIRVFDHPNTIALSPDGKLLFVSCRGPNNPTKGYLYKGLVMGHLDIIDTATLKVIESIEAGNQPTGLAVSPDGKKIVLSDFLDNRVRLFEKVED